MAKNYVGAMRMPIVLSILMMLMTQAGYLDAMNPWSREGSGGEETLDEITEVFETGGSSNFSSFAYANNKMSTGSLYTCAILDNGDLKCWGYDYYGQLGDGGSNTDTNAPSSTPINLGTNRTAVAVSAGYYHTCAILDNGDLKCWGSDSNGQLGDGGSTNTNTNAPSSTAINLGTGRTAVAVSAGDYHTCAILDNGDLKCWGRDNFGQLGDGGTNTDTNAPSSTAIDLGTGRTAVAVSAGDYHTCAILDNGDLKCWGWDNYGQLGDGGTNTDTNAPSSTAIDLGTGRTAVAVSAGDYHTCAILDNGDLKCWGYDGYGELGDGGGNMDLNAPSSTAINLGSGRTAVAVATGFYHTCAILDNGEAKCWGRDNFGQLGDGGTNTDTNAPSSTPINLGTNRTAVAVATGSYHTCAILDNDEAKCWGYDGNGQLGDGGSNTDQNSPVTVSGSNTWDSSTGLSSGGNSTGGNNTGGNTVDCGTNASNVSFEVEAEQPVWYRHDTVSAHLDTYCGVWGEMYRVDWVLVSQLTSSVFDQGQSLFETNNSSVSYHPNHTDHFNEVDIHFHYMDTGNYTILGNFYVLANTTWTHLANVSDTFQVNGTNTTTVCGYNETLVSMEVPVAGYHSYEGDSVYPYADIECPVLGTSYVFEWELYEQNSSTVVQTGWNNFTATWQNVHLFNDGSGFFHDINLAFHNLTEGNYIWSTMLTLSNGSYLDWAELTFEVWSNATNSTGCGYDSTYTSIYAYSLYGIFSEGDTFDSTVNSYCNLLNSTTMIEWTVAYTSNSTIVAQQNQSWYVNSTSSTWSITHNPLLVGNYTFTAMLSVWNNTAQGWDLIDEDAYNFAYVANTTTPGGFVDIDTNGYNFTSGDTVAAVFESYNLTQGEMYSLVWAVVDANSNVVDQGNWTWMAYNHFSVEWKNYTVDGAPLQSGFYCFFGELYHVDATYSLTSLDNDDTCIMIAGGNGTGGNSTGNNTGGNNTGGNNTGGNSTGNSTGNNTGGNNTGGNNTTDTDSDGVPDVLDAFPYDPAEWEDTDGDGVGDNGDNCPTVANPNQADGDNDGIGTACDSNEGGNTGNGTGGNGTSGNNTGGNTTNPPMNSPPVVSSVTIMPVLPTDADTLTCSYTTYDADGDSVSATVQWEVNGNVILVGAINLTSGFAVGDDVECTVTAYDGQMSGNTDSDMVTILPSTVDDAIDAGNGLPALSTVGTLVAIAFGVGLSRRKDE